MPDRKLYQGITRPVFAKLRAGLEKAHIPLPEGDAGTIASRGVHGTFRFDEPASSLQLTIDKHPMLIPKSMLWAGIEKAIAEAQDR